MSRHVHASLYARVSFHTAASMMALQKAQEGFGQRWPRRAINSFQNLPKNQKRTRLNALLVFPCCRAGATPHGAVGFSFLGIPVCLNPVFSPRVWTLRGFPSGAALLPHPGGCAVSTRRPPFIKRCRPRWRCVYPGVPPARTFCSWSMPCLLRCVNYNPNKRAFAINLEKKLKFF